jgi:periplasmic copper chaperone A
LNPAQRWIIEGIMKQLFLAIVFSMSVGMLGIDKVWAHDAAEHITHVMKAQFDTPDNPLTVEPVTVGGDFAVAGWRQGDKGGRALLRMVDGNWSIHLCSGDGLKDAAVLHQAGIPEDIAKDIAARVAEAEAKLDPAILKQFASFEGTVVIDEAGGHGHGAHGNHKNPEEATQ